MFGCGFYNKNLQANTPRAASYISKLKTSDDFLIGQNWFSISWSWDFTFSCKCNWDVITIFFICVFWQVSSLSLKFTKKQQHTSPRWHLWGLIEKNFVSAWAQLWTFFSEPDYLHWQVTIRIVILTPTVSAHLRKRCSYWSWNYSRKLWANNRATFLIFISVFPCNISMCSNFCAMF